MRIPNTPQTVIAQLVDPQKAGIWNGAWRRFFDLYHAPIKIMVSNSFYKRGWYGTPSHVVDDVVADVVMSLNKAFGENKYDPKKSRFRFFLKTICERRVVDYIRKNSADMKNDSIDDKDGSALHCAEAELSGEADAQLADEEIRALKHSLIMDAYTAIRHNFDARTCAAFEMIKLENANMEDVVRELGVSTNVVNNAVYRITKKLREALLRDEKMKEFYHE